MSTRSTTIGLAAWSDDVGEAVGSAVGAEVSGAEEGAPEVVLAGGGVGGGPEGGTMTASEARTRVGFLKDPFVTSLLRILATWLSDMQQITPRSRAM